MDSVSGVGVLDKGVLILRALRQRTARPGRAAAGDRPAAGDGAPAGGRARAAPPRAPRSAGPVLPRLRADRAWAGRPRTSSPSPSWPAGAHGAARRDRRERAAVRPRGRRPALRRVAAVAARLRWIVPEGALLPLARLRRAGAAGRRHRRERRGARARRRVGQRPGARSQGTWSSPRSASAARSSGSAASRASGSAARWPPRPKR